MEGSADASYRVVFGVGRGASRSRAQTVADLYQELRDRTALGSRLEAEAHAVGDAVGAAPSGLEVDVPQRKLSGANESARV